MFIEQNMSTKGQNIPWEYHPSCVRVALWQKRSRFKIWVDINSNGMWNRFICFHTLVSTGGKKDFECYFNALKMQSTAPKWSYRKAAYETVSNLNGAPLNFLLDITCPRISASLPTHYWTLPSLGPSTTLQFLRCLLIVPYFTYIFGSTDNQTTVKWGETTVLPILLYYTVHLFEVVDRYVKQYSH